MLVNAYDPLAAPIPREWLALSDFERIDLVEAFHVECGDFGDSLRLHASVHVVVENQLAVREPSEAAQALERLMRQGLDRHEAVRAIGAVLAEFLLPILGSSTNPPPFDEPGYREGLRRASPGSWRGGR